jgi:pimeloyl-ACP methyl ester carboxylesterase
VQEDGWFYHPDLDRTCRIVSSDMPFEEARPYYDNWPRHSAQCFMDPLTYEGWRDVPVSYLLCEKDACLPADFQKTGIEMIEQGSGNKVDVTSLAESGHAPNVSRPKDVAEWIVGMAEKHAL